MFRLVKKCLFFNSTTSCSFVRRDFSKLKIEIKEEVRYALENKKSVVALESTIITHGMPFPNNIKCALDVEHIVRQQGAVPATIAIVKGIIKVGISEDELNYLGDIKISTPIKTSRRDMSFVVSNKQNGGTTVSGTLIVARRVGIPIFATGGIGGVHRGANESFDISADLLELGKSNVAVISSGVKSILDIPKTLEYLETQGVFVATFGDTCEFPAFYSRQSGSKSPYYVETAIDAANIIKCNRNLDLGSGMLFAVPVPEDHSLPMEIMNSAIETALEKAQGDENVQGKNVTPYILSQVANITKGKSLQTNIALIKNNAKIAADIAVALEKLEEEEEETRKRNLLDMDMETLKGRPVIIGGSNLDCSATLDSTDIKLDGRIHDGRFSYAAGGVGRNVCEALCKLGCPSNFISVIGKDMQGDLLKSFIPPKSRHFLRVVENKSTAQCIIVLDQKGECKFLMGDMQIHKQITPELIKSHEAIIKTSPLIILDSNLTVEAIEEALKLADRYCIPVLFEPTDVEISAKPFQTSYWKAIQFITPNLNELRYIASYLKISTEERFSSNISEAAYICKTLVNYFDNIIVTLGPNGVLISRKSLATDPFLQPEKKNNSFIRHYPGAQIDNFVNVNGAGDCWASGFIVALLSGLTEEKCVSVGFAAAQSALYSHCAVPDKIIDKSHSAWNTPAAYQTIL